MFHVIGYAAAGWLCLGLIRDASKDWKNDNWIGRLFVWGLVIPGLTLLAYLFFSG